MARGFKLGFFGLLLHVSFNFIDVIVCFVLAVAIITGMAMI